jgi:hypothetical protein
MIRFSSLLECLLFFILASLLALFGTGIPVHFNAMAPGILVEAGRDSENIKDLADSFLNAGEVGPAALLWSADEDLPDSEKAQSRLDELLESNPHYRLSGGPAPYFEQFLQMTGSNRVEKNKIKTLELLIPRGNRDTLLSYLKFSNNSSVHFLLSTRDLISYSHFMPVSSPAGQPLDATILMNALLVQGGHFSPEFIRILNPVIDLTIEDSWEDGSEALETFYLNMLTLGKRFNWLQLTTLTRLFTDLDAVASAADVFRRFPNRTPQLYAMFLLSKDPSGVADYISDLDKERMEDMLYALPLGRGAIISLMQSRKPLYRPPALVQWIDKPIAWVRQAPLLSFTHQHPQAAINIKLVVILISGFALALGVSSLFETSARNLGSSRLEPLLILRNTIIALFFSTTVWVLIEPSLLDIGSEPKAKLRLVFEFANKIESLKSKNVGSAMLDQITILILIIFFLLQLIIYVMGIIKVSEIKKMDASPKLRLNLLDNEDNLFDLGLYVGLGGTVLSLILLAMDIVQASLIAAYASTLFGIIFVAILKVFHVRPLRRNIIINVENTVHESRVTTDSL